LATSRRRKGTDIERAWKDTVLYVATLPATQQR
jgi:hypothetical protein